MNTIFSPEPGVMEIRRDFSVEDFDGRPPSGFLSKDCVKVQNDIVSHARNHLDLRFGTKDYLIVSNILKGIPLGDLARSKDYSKIRIFANFDQPLELSKYATKYLMAGYGPNGPGNGSKEFVIVLLAHTTKDVHLLTAYYKTYRMG